MTAGWDPTKPLLSKNGRTSTEHDTRKTRVTRWNSVNSLKSAFLSMLPDKVRSSLDSESPFDVDLSNTTSLSQLLELFYSLGPILTHYTSVGIFLMHKPVKVLKGDCWVVY
jgi:hypothetical protein